MKPLSILPFFLLAVSLSGAAATSSLSADAIAAEVLSTNPELRFYAEELNAARSSARLAGAARDPELSLQAGRQRVVDPAGVLQGEGTAWSITLAQTFAWPGRLALRKAVANRDVALAELGLRNFEAALAARARTVAHGLWVAQEKAAAAVEVAGRFRALKETVLARDPAGLTPLLELRVLEAQELTLQRRATAADLALQSALVELNQLRGLPPTAPAAVVAPLPMFTDAPALEELLAAAREHNFVFRAKQLELEQQGYAVQLARHERYPEFTVSPYVSRESADGRDTTIGVGLSLPLPLSARSRAGIELASARRLQAEAAVRVAQRDMEREVISTAQVLAAKRAEMLRWSPDAAVKFREAAALADRHYRLGAVPLATYLELQTAYLEAVEVLLDTQQEAFAAGQQLQLLTGLDFHGVATEGRP